VPTTVITPVEGWIVAILGLVEVYTIGAELLLDGVVVILKGASVVILLDGTTKEDAEIVFCNFTIIVSEPEIRWSCFSPYVLNHRICREVSDG
jgi:hypothetical protein